MPQNDNSHVKQAAEYWIKGQPLEAGRLIFENLPNELRPKWAARILRLVLERSGVERSHFGRILDTADHPTQWANGHRCFDILRNSTLELLELQKKQGLTKEQVLLYALISLAELVAKVTYNAADPPDEFDEDSGWWIAACLRGFVDNIWPDERFAAAAWSALCAAE